MVTFLLHVLHHNFYIFRRNVFLQIIFLELYKFKIIWKGIQFADCIIRNAVLPFFHSQANAHAAHKSMFQNALKLTVSKYHQNFFIKICFIKIVYSFSYLNMYCYTRCAIPIKPMNHNFEFLVTFLAAYN